MLVDAAEILQSEVPPEEPIPHEENSIYGEDIILPSIKRRESIYRRNTCVINLALSMLAGVFIGALLNDTSLATFFNAPYIKQGNAEFASVFMSSMLDIVFYLSVIFVLGFSALSLPAAALVPFLKGLGIGFNLALAVASGTGNAVLIVAMALPYVLLSGICVILASKECIGFSYMLFGLVTKGGQQVYIVNPVGAKYARIFVNLLLVGIVAAAVNGLIFSIIL